MRNNRGFTTLILTGVFALALIGLVVLWIYTKEESKLAQPKVETEKSYTVLAVGDIACDPTNPNFNGGNGQGTDCQHKKVVEQMKKQNPDAILLLGDIQYYRGEAEAYEKSFVPAYMDFPSKIIAVPGNHDWMTGNINGYIKTFEKYFPSAQASGNGETYFVSKIGKWNIYALDSNCEYVGGCGEGSPQYEWLKSQLTKDSSLCALAIWHHPIFTAGFHRADGGEKRAVKLYDLLQKNSVELVLNGHDHNYQRFAKKLSDGRLSAFGIRSFVSGGGGAELHKISQPLELGEDYAESGHGFLKLSLNEKTYSWQFVAVNGQAIDSGQDTCRQ